MNLGCTLVTLRFNFVDLLKKVQNFIYQIIVRVNISTKQILFNKQKKQKTLTEAYLNLNQDAFKHNNIQPP